MKKVLQRDKSNKVVAGVCSGLANYFDSDPVVIRAIFLLLLFIGGGGAMVYIILWILVPDNTRIYFAGNNSGQSSFVPSDARPTETSAQGVNISMGLLLLSAGILLLINNIVPRFEFDKFWPVILIVVGGGLIIGRKRINTEKESNNEGSHKES